jgi:carboxymethylenebutenolidase
LDDHIKDVAERFAAAGYVALAPDLYRGEVAAEPDDARRLAMELELDQALVDIQGAVNYLISQPDVEPKQAGVIGFCMGGRLTMMMSYRGENVGAAIVFYGGGVQPSDEELRAISAPLLGIYGEADEGIPVDRIHEWDTKLDEFGKTHEIHIYPDAPHAFFNDERPSYRATASADAWDRTLAWLNTYLRA